MIGTRIRTFALACAALVLFAAILFPPGVWDDGYLPRTTEDDVGGLSVLVRWLREGDVPVVSLRERFDGLARFGRGNVLLVHPPLVEFLRPDERDAVLDFVRRGNALVIASRRDEDLRSVRADRDLLGLAPGLERIDVAEEENVLAAIDRLDLLEVPPPWVLALGGYERRTLRPGDAHPVTRGLGPLHGIGDLAHHVWMQSDPNGGEGAAPRTEVPWLTLLVDAGSGSEVAWTREFDKGSITVLHHPSILSNGGLGQGDNARFAWRLLTGPLAADGRVLIDDGHQGLLEDMTGDELLGDARSWLTLLVGLLVWFVWLLADDGRWERVTRAPEPPLRRRADLLRAMGGFLSRHLDQAEALDALLAPLRERLARRHGVSVERALDALSTEANVSAQARDALKETLERAERRRRIDLVRTQRLVLELQESIG